jgi:hypothetical protein
MPTRSLPQARLAKGETVGHGCEAAAVHTATNASSTMIRQKQESTKDAHLTIVISPSKIEAGAESADPSRSHHDQRVLTATALKHRGGAVPHVLKALALVTLAALPHMAEAAAAPIIGAAHQRQGGDGVTTSTTSQSQTDLEGVDMIALGGQVAVVPRGGPTRTEAQQQWDGLKASQIQAYVAKHQTETKTRFRVGTTAMASASTVTVATSFTPPHAEQ